MTRPHRILGAALLTLAVAASACASNNGGSAATTAAAKAAGAAATASGTSPGKDAKKVGFIFVGPKDDYGYNQAAYEGSQSLKKSLTGIEVLTAENVTSVLRSDFHKSGQSI